MIKIIIAFLFYLSVHSQNELHLNEDNLYIFTRSTKLKVDYIAKDFNLKDTLSTHVGIGFFKNGSCKIYNVSNTKTYNNSALICDNFETFTNISDIKYVSIWKTKIDKKHINKLEQLICEYKNVKFDDSFLLNNKNNLYCSEFVALVLNKLDSTTFKLKPVIKKLNFFYSNALHREHIKYFPVDYFLKYDAFELTYNKFY